MRALKGPIRLLKYVVGARVAREGSTARRTAEEAAEIAAHREEREASTELIRQQATGQYIANLRETADLPPHLQPLAIAKIVKDDPTVLEQVNRIEEVMRDLGTRCGTRIEVVSGPAVIQTNEPPETPELEAPGKAE
ncbi:MAG: hypothetical protein JW809_14830 [Pirellulales bacterium]|nr:hypothetical protein [Pirellulales bacterium]